MRELDIKTLHLQSQEWIDQLNFWKDEMDFIKDLLFLRVNPAQIGDQAYKLDTQFDDFAEKIKQISQNTLNTHEAKLWEMSQSKSKLDAYDHTEVHKYIEKQLNTLQKEMISFKKELIYYYRNWLDI